MLIFLDIDGVMVPAIGWKSPELLHDGFPAFSHKAKATLQRLIADDTIIMLTTSHKSNFSIEEWKGLFRNRGVDIENVRSLPANVNHLSRKDEIMNWFSVNDFDGDFIIIDDDQSLNELPDFLKGNFIQTSPYIGLTEEHLQDVNARLNRGV